MEYYGNSAKSYHLKKGTVWNQTVIEILHNEARNLLVKACEETHDAKWFCDLFMCDMIKPGFILPPDIRQLRDLIRHRVKLTNMLTGEKNRTLNCLTVSNLKLDDVFSDVFGRSSRSIISFILNRPGANVLF